MAAGDADEHAPFRRLFEDAYRPLLAYALRRTQNAADAEEIVADTLLIAWRRRDELPADAERIAWLYGVARKVIANQRRGQQRRSRLEQILAPLTRASRDADESVQLADATRAVLAASRRLPDVDQEVLRLAAWEGLSHAEIAIALGCSENAAALRLHRARQHLREELTKEGLAPGHERVEVTR
jgi:RNA polymerase sigma-70 factor (ECF subfamily)